MKAVMHYIFLVGIPVLIVLLLLQAGERYLRAPVSVGGNWKLLPFSDTLTTPCSELAFGAEDPLMNISQSGPHLVLKFNDEALTTLPGTLNGFDISGTSHSYTHPESITLQATVSLDVEPDQLDGTLYFASCETTVSFHATREPIVEQTGGGH